MKKHKLKISGNKTLLNEVDIGLDQILKTTGVGETAKVMNQILKVASANVKLAFEFVFSFRTLSLKGIANNIESANKRFSSRVRFAMRSISREIEGLSSNSKINEAFACTFPGIAIFNHVRKEIDNAGGFYNYTQDYSQNLYVGDITTDIYTGITGALQKATNLRASGLGNSQISKEEVDEKTRSIILKDIRNNFGIRAEEIIEDLFDGKETDDTIKLIDIITNKQDLSEQDKEKALVDFFNNLKENKISFKRKILIEKNSIKKANYKKSYGEIISLIINKTNLAEKVIKDLFENKETSEKNLKEDIKELSVLFNSLIIDFFIFSILEDYIKFNKINVDNVVRKIENNFPKVIDKKIEKEIKKFLGDFSKKFKDKEEKDAIQIFIGVLKQIESDMFYKSEKFKKYYKKLNNYCNSKDDGFIELKKLCSKIYKKNNSFKIKEVENILIEKAKKINEDSK